MKPQLFDLFYDTRSNAIEYEGKTVYCEYFIPVDRPGRLVVRFLHVSDERPQCVSVGLRKGKVTIGDATSSGFIICSDTAPEPADYKFPRLEHRGLSTLNRDTELEPVEIKFKPPRQGGILEIHNAWNTKKTCPETGVAYTNAYEGNAGMLVEQTGNKYMFRCSDWEGPPKFDDLVFEIEMLED